MNNQEINSLVEKSSSEYEDGTLGIEECLNLYLEDNNLPYDASEIAEQYIKNEALSCGIPKSVINGDKKLSECFSKDYIQSQVNN